MKELIIIQSQLKAPKNQFNAFGKYNYRSCEDILEGVKPLLKVNNCHLTIGDTITQIGNYNYITAHVTIANSEGESITVTGVAREADAQKGMNPAQITGSTSSYARKYALNGLFCIDDTKDDDTKPPPPVKTKEELEAEKQKFIDKVKVEYNKVTDKPDALQQWIAQIDTYTDQELVTGMKKIQATIKKQEKTK